MADVRELYRTATPQRRELQVRYPTGRGRILLRTDLDWDHDIEPVAVSEDGPVSVLRAGELLFVDAP